MIQFALLAAVGLAGTEGPAWEGSARQVGLAVGALLVGAGVVLAGKGLIDLQGALTPLPHPRDGAELVDRGSYRLVRHPIYGGIVIAAAGFGLVTASPLALGGAVALLGFFRLKSEREEHWLSSRYPGYETYRARTRRMIPLLY